MTKTQSLIREVAHYIYDYRKKKNIPSSQMQDWCIAEDIIFSWKKEYKEAGAEFLNVWLDKFYHKRMEV